MEEKHRKIAMLLALPLGPILIFLSLFFSWYLFVGTAEYYWGTVEVSGWVSMIGVGTLDRTSARVTMWSSPTYWSTAGSDFWLGYLNIVGLILMSTSLLIFIKTDKPKMSIPLALLGYAIAVSASLIAIVYYEPYIFVILGQIDDLPIDAARLYATKAIVNIGLGPWLSLIGSILYVISIVSFHRLKI